MGVGQAILYAVALAILVGAGTLVLGGDSASFWLNISSEVIGLLLGGFVVAFFTEALLDRQAAKRWAQVRAVLLPHVRDAVHEVAYVARMHLRRGLSLEPLSAGPLSAALRSFASQLEGAYYDKYHWRFPAGARGSGAYKADEAYVYAMNHVEKVSRELLPSVQAYLPAVVSAGDQRLVELLVRTTKHMFLVGYFTDRPMSPQLEVGRARNTQGELVDFLKAAADLCELIDEETSAHGYYLELGEKAYQEELENDRF